MKQIVENNQSQQRITIQVKTLPNGYSLDLEKENFMYYSPMVLFANDLVGRNVRPCGHEPRGRYD